MYCFNCKLLRVHKVRLTEYDDENIKKTVKPRKGRLFLIIAFISFLLIDVLLIGEYKARGVNAVGYQLMEKVNEVFESGAGLVTSIWEPEIDHDGDLTSALIIGIDSREVEFTGTEFINTNPKPEFGTRNTDTIIQVVYDHSNGNVFMISIPRDMGVDVNKSCLEFHGSLHWVYDKGQSANCPGGGVQTLIDTVEGVTGIEIQYYGFVTLDLFVEAIDTIGDINENGEKGIWIDIPEPVYELYPVGDNGWESIYFPAGYQFLTSEEALKFARSRKASSDFARARRQQLVIKAVKDRALSSETLLNPKKLYELMQSFKKNTLFSEPSLEEIRAGLNIVRDLDDSEIINIVLDPDLGGYRESLINKQPHGRITAQYYMVPTHWAECPGNEFCMIQDYLKNVIEYPDVYKEQAKVYAYARDFDESWQPNFNNISYINLKDSNLPLVFKESRYVANVDAGEDLIIYDFTNGEKSQTILLFEGLLGAEVRDGSEAPHVQLNGEDFSIVVKGN